MKDTTSQADRFREAARAVGADESDDALDRAMGKLDFKAKPKGESGKGQSSQTKDR